MTALRRLLTNPAALLGLCIALLVGGVVRDATQPPPAPPPPVLQQLASSIDEQFHECVPLGWFPDTRPWRGYVPGYNTDVSDKGALFQALWVGVVPVRALNDPRAPAVKAVLDELTGLGLLVRHDLPGEFRYTLTHEGERYYYERNHLGNNVEGWSYLCFSRLHAKHVAWASGGRVRFTWEPAAEAHWATPFVKAHAVELNPTSSPAEVMARRYPNGTWRLAQLEFTFPLVEHPEAWRTP